jgi:hypothetical protein
MLSGRGLFTLVAAGILLALTGTPVLADGIKPVGCNRTPKPPKCTITVGTPGGGGNQNNGNGGEDSGDGSGSDDGTWNGCAYEPAPGNPPPPAGKTPKDGGWYVEVCLIGDGKGGPQTSAPMWIDGPAPTVDPAEIARQAVAQLTLPRPDIKVNPNPPARQFVYLPTWLWLDSSSWASQSATASVPGLSVTAVAKPTKLVFSPGDGGKTVRCTGRGTAWTRGLDPDKKSPTCGHTYTRPGSFTLTATVTWQISWAGGGQTGTVPDLTTTASRSLTVTESQGLNTTTRG